MRGRGTLASLALTEEVDAQRVRDNVVRARKINPRDEEQRHCPCRGPSVQRLRCGAVCRHDERGFVERRVFEAHEGVKEARSVLPGESGVEAQVSLLMCNRVHSPSSIWYCCGRQ